MTTEKFPKSFGHVIGSNRILNKTPDEPTDSAKFQVSDQDLHA